MRVSLAFQRRVANSISSCIWRAVCFKIFVIVNVMFNVASNVSCKMSYD